MFPVLVAKLTWVEENAINNWENNHMEPRLYVMSKIIEFLGYVPFDVHKETLGDKIITYLKMRGLS
jgi:DNA-binding XRE family transcriptional regulator